LPAVGKTEFTSNVLREDNEELNQEDSGLAVRTSQQKESGSDCPQGYSMPKA
jgi:hypothetical protein